MSASVLAISWLHTGLGCAPPEDDVEYSSTTSALSVGGAVTGSCSTSSVRGLSLQIAREANCASPGSFVQLSSSANLRFTSNAVLPFMHSSAKTDLLRVASAHALTVNSGFRTVAQQYLLYRWFQQHRCGISKAALPGTSNHESGRAVDLSNWSTRVSAMAGHHWSHDVPGDPVHFDHLTSPDNRGKDVAAFQRLWNRNHPGDKIAVDGDYGPQTAARLRQAPAKGFAKGPACARVAIAPDTTEPISLTQELDILAIEGPDRVASGERVHYVVSLAMPEPAPASVRLAVQGGSASELYDATTWTSPSEVGTIAMTADGDVALDLAAPQVTEDSAYTVTLAVSDGTRTIGTFDLALVVSPDPASSGTSSDDGENDDDASGVPADADGVVDSGCSAGGRSSAGTFVLLAIAFVGVRRQRARRSSQS